MRDVQDLLRNRAAEMSKNFGYFRESNPPKLRRELETWKDARDTFLAVSDFLSSHGKRFGGMTLLKAGEESKHGTCVVIAVDLPERRCTLGMVKFFNDDRVIVTTDIIANEEGSYFGKREIYLNDRGRMHDPISEDECANTLGSLNLLRHLAESLYSKEDVSIAVKAVVDGLDCMAKTAKRTEDNFFSALSYSSGLEREPIEDALSPRF